MKQHCFVSLTIVIAIVLLMAARAIADDSAVAKAHYELGTTAFDLQRYSEAAYQYELAFEAKHEPVLLFNIGQAYRMAGDNAKAIRAYKTYLARVPNAGNRVEVERRVAELQRALDQQTRAKEGPPEGTIAPGQSPKAVVTAPPSQTTVVRVAEPPKSPSVPIYKKWWLWAIVSVAIVGTAVGLGVGLTRSSDYPSFFRTPTDGAFHW